MAKSPLQVLEETLARIEQLRMLAEREWDEMTEGERAASDEVIADLEDSARELSDDFLLEILEERRERLIRVSDRYIDEMRAAREYRDFGAALSYGEALRDMIVLEEILNEMIEDEEAVRYDQEDTP